MLQRHIVRLSQYFVYSDGHCLYIWPITVSVAENRGRAWSMCLKIVMSGYTIGQTIFGIDDACTCNMHAIHMQSHSCQSSATALTIFIGHIHVYCLW